MRNPVWIATLITGLISASPVSADYVSQTVILDQSNALKDGVAYGGVLVEAYDGLGVSGGGLNAGEVRLTFSANVVDDYVSLKKSFGIDRVGFNSDLAISAGQIATPAGWKLKNNKNMDGFGKFAWIAHGPGDRLNPLTLLINGLGADATPEHFLIGSAGKSGPPSQGAVYFAAHVAGFTVLCDDISSHFIGGSDVGADFPPPPEGSGEVRPTPEPTSLLMSILGVGCVGLMGFVRLRMNRR